MRYMPRRSQNTPASRVIFSSERLVRVRVWYAQLGPSCRVLHRQTAVQAQMRTPDAAMCGEAASDYMAL